MLSTVVAVDVVSEERIRFTGFVRELEPRLRRALCLLRGPVEGRDATAEALAWAWEHWAEVQAMENPAGYLYRVGSSRSRPRRARFLPAPIEEPARGFEPGLIPALAALSERQRTAVVLVHGCGWTYQEVAQALGTSKTAVGTHVERALKSGSATSSEQMIMDDVREQIRAWADQAAPHVSDEVTADEILDPARRRRSARAGAAGRVWRIAAVAACLVVVAGGAVLVGRRDGDVRVDTDRQVADTGPEVTGYPADRAERWFRSLMDVGMAIDRGPTDFAAALRQGRATLYVGTIAETPEVRHRTRRTPDGSTLPGRELSVSYLAVSIDIEGASSPVPIEFDLGAAGSPEEADAEALAPPVGTRVLVVSDHVEPLRIVLGYDVVVETNDGGLLAGGDLTRSVADRTDFDDLVQHLFAQTARVDRRDGPTTESFIVSGDGCPDGIVTIRTDGSSWLPIQTGADGSWSATLPFPWPPGAHTLTLDCSDQSTVGSPTTMLGPGTKRFDYAPVDVTTTGG